MPACLRTSKRCCARWLKYFVAFVAAAQLCGASAALNDFSRGFCAFTSVPQLASPIKSVSATCSKPANELKQLHTSPSFRRPLGLKMSGSPAGGMKLLQELLRTLPNTGGYGSFSELFSKFDLDRSGAIDAAELRTALCDMGAKVTDEQVDSLLRSIDANGDGQVDWTEFQNALELAEMRILQEWEASERD